MCLYRSKSYMSFILMLIMTPSSPITSELDVMTSGTIFVNSITTMPESIIYVLSLSMSSKMVHIAHGYIFAFDGLVQPETFISTT